MRSARAIGLVMLLVPVAVVLGLALFPSYDVVTSPGFARTFDNIVEAGNDYLISLLVFLVAAGLLAVLAAGLSRSPLRGESSSIWVVVAGLGISSVGFGVAGLAGLPVWNWAKSVSDGSESISSMASRSEALAALSQNLLLMLGLGGLLVGMSVLGIVAVVRGWTPKPAFIATVIVALGVVLVGVFASGPVFWLAFGVPPLLWALVFGLMLTVRGHYTPQTVKTEPASATRTTRT